MVYGYIRVSTDKQTVENQRFEINNFCESNKMIVDKWISDEGISGTKDPSKRDLGKLLKKAKKGDIIICSELSRLGRNLLMIMSKLNYCMEQQIKIWTIKDNYRLGDDISSKVLAFAFGISAEIERNLISQRTKDALARKKAEGVVLGRPVGAKSQKTKLTGQEKKIYELLQKKISYSAIGRLLGVHRLTVSTFVKERIDENGKIKPLISEEDKVYQLLEPFHKEIVEAFLRGVPMYELAKQYNVPQQKISNFIRQYKA